MDDGKRRVALVTGGSRGIGAAVVRRLARDGLAVVVGYGHDANAAGVVVDEVVASGGAAVAVGADVADESAVASAFDVAQKQFGGVDVVVNAAGVMPTGPLLELAVGDLDQLLRVNVRGAVVVLQEAMRRTRAGGSIVLVSSSTTRFAAPGTAAYQATKAAVESLALVSAKELAGREVTVNVVAPGAIETEMLNRYLAGGGQNVRSDIADRSPFRRIGQPEDVADVVSFLAGPSRWVNGQVVHANGGAI